MNRQPIRRALVSVSDKTGLGDFARALADAGVEIVSTGSTAATIREAGVAVTEVAEVTGFPEIMDGRVKTLHPAIHGGILANRTLESHNRQLAEHGIAPFDLVVVNLYPFSETVASDADAETVIENIDIGGPTLVRAAAKNFLCCTVVVEPEDYETVLATLPEGGPTLAQRRSLAATAFENIFSYDMDIMEWFAEQEEEASQEESEQPEIPETYMFELDDETMHEYGMKRLRYGENPHQRAVLTQTEDGLGAAEQLGGKEMSYNNYVDVDAAIRAAYDHSEPCVAVIKHNNPCGIAVGSGEDPIAAAHRAAHATDPLSAYGGVIAANRPVTAEMARQVAPVFTEVIAAPGYSDEALEILLKKKNLRVLALPEDTRRGEVEVRELWGATLLQDTDRVAEVGDSPEGWQQVAGGEVSTETLADLAFAWRAVRAAKSNAILLAKDGAAVGIGMGQVNRLDSCRLAVSRANTLADGAERARGSVAASDAFFPFADGVEILIEAGVAAIVSPGGSIRDDEVIAACDKAGVPLFFTGVRHFAH
ncbi:bifunctional phosphoribosylaminoimidazolecarboxamide formyltransferase/IMP cyclohydrolase [Dermabacteraceae bacterium P13138]